MEKLTYGCDFIQSDCLQETKDCIHCDIIYRHLCDTCKNIYPECDAKNLKFGCDVNSTINDNIFYCESYQKKDKIQTNGDWIRSLDDEYLAEVIANSEKYFNCDICKYIHDSVEEKGDITNCNGDCESYMRIWLGRKHEENGID